MNNQE